MVEKVIIMGNNRVNLRQKISPPVESPLYSRVVPNPITVGQTIASMITPNAYILKLRGSNLSVHQRQFTADHLIVRNTIIPPQTIGLSAINVTNDISVAGPIINGRDQVAAFATTWVYWYVIHNPDTFITASLCSLSPTTPTLPSGYTFFVRVGSGYVDGSGNIIGPDAQVGNTHFYRTLYANLLAGSNDTYENLSISLSVPPTANWIFGYIGTTSAAAVFLGVGIASNVSGLTEYTVNGYMAGVTSGYSLGGALYYSLPLVTAQQISWKSSNKLTYVGIGIQGYIDDL